MSISVCMAVRNGATFLPEQLHSILPQLGNGDELVVSDDASDDLSLQILKATADTRIRILPSRAFGNPSRNFEYALGHCKNEIIFLADQDDIWYPRKINKMVTELGDVDLVICDCR